MASAQPLQPTPYAALLRWRLELRELRDAAQYKANHLGEALKKIPAESPLHRGLSAESYEADCKLAALNNELAEVRRQLRSLEKKSEPVQEPSDPPVKVPETVAAPEPEAACEPAPQPVVEAKPEPPPLPDYVVRGALEPQRDRSTADWLEVLRERARKQP